jgi:hypothetical protein
MTAIYGDNFILSSIFQNIKGFFDYITLASSRRALTLNAQNSKSRLDKKPRER